MNKKKQLTSEFKFVSKDTLDTCAKYVKLSNDNQVQVQVLYRYGKPSNYLESTNEFIKEYNNFYR